MDKRSKQSEPYSLYSVLQVQKEPDFEVVRPCQKVGLCHFEQDLSFPDCTMARV